MILTLIGAGAGESHIFPRVLLYKIKAMLVTMEVCNQLQKDLEYPWSILYFIYIYIVCVYITIYGYQDMGHFLFLYRFIWGSTYSSDTAYTVKAIYKIVTLYTVQQ